MAEHTPDPSDQATSKIFSHAGALLTHAAELADTAGLRRPKWGDPTGRISEEKEARRLRAEILVARQNLRKEVAAVYRMLRCDALLDENEI